MARLRECECPEPNRHSNPRYPQKCVRCGWHISSEWDSNSENIKSFFDHLESVFPGSASDDFRVFRQECERRELAGRKTFKHRYLARDNRVDAREEAADLANYMYFDVLQNLRLTGTEDEKELALTAAYHAYKAYEATLRLGRKRQGSP